MAGDHRLASELMQQVEENLAAYEAGFVAACPRLGRKTDADDIDLQDWFQPGFASYH
jgi:hypothetical protein